MRSYDPAHHVTDYAADMPAEDFAEVFNFYLRHKGRLPVRLASKPVIVRKWRFVAAMARCMAAGRRSFKPRRRLIPPRRSFLKKAS